MSMDNMKNKAEDLKGQAKEKIGEATDNESMQADGLVDQAKSKAKQAVDDVKDAFN